MYVKGLRALAFICFLAGCGTREPLPPLPEVPTASFLPAIREAIDSALAAARSQPNDAAAAGRLGMVLHAHDQRAAARRCYERASLIEPRKFDWQYYLALVSDGAEAAEALLAALRLRDYLPAKLKLGEVLLAAGDSDGARAVYRDLDHPAALFGYGRAAGDPSYYEKALARFPQYGAAMFALAQHYRRTAREADAQRLMADYEKFKTVAPPVEDPLLDAVRALNRGPDRLLAESARLDAQGDLTAAVDLQLKALEVDPRLAQAHINLVSLYGRIGDAASAEKHYRAAIELNQNAHEAYYNFGVLCYQANRRREAQAAFEQALAINPGYAEAHDNLGAMLEAQGRLAEAERHFQRAIELKPDLRLARFHLGRIYANQRRFSQAIEQFERIISINDGATPTYLYALGATRARAGDSAGAAPILAAARDQAIAHGQAPLAASIERDLRKLKR